MTFAVLLAALAGVLAAASVVELVGPREPRGAAAGATCRVGDTSGR